MDTHVIAVVLASLIGMVTGAVWYSPLMFAKPWMRLSKISEARMKNVDMTRTYSIMFASLLLGAYVLSLVLQSMGADSVLTGAGIGLLVGLGFVATSNLTAVIFQDKPITLYLIDTGYYVVTFILMGALLAVWK